MPNRVNEVQQSILDDEKQHELNRALRIGIREMRKLAFKGKYMRPNPGELELVRLGGEQGSTIYVTEQGNRVSAGTDAFTVYELRLLRSCMKNVWASTIKNLARLPFRERIDLVGWDDELQGRSERDPETGRLVPVVRGWVADIDGQGRSLDEWAAEAFEDALFEGVVYGFVDNDSREFASPAERQAAGARPHVAKLKRGDFTFIIVEHKQGAPPRLAAICFYSPIQKHSVADPNAWVDEQMPAWKVVTAGDPAALKGTEERKVRVSVYVQPENSDPVEVPELVKTIVPDDPRDELLDIPLVPLYTKRTGPWRGESPFIDTGEIQVAIWNSTSEWLNKMRETALSIVHETGVKTNPATDLPVLQDTRSMRYRWSSDPHAQLNIVEASGQSLEAISKGIEQLIAWVEDEHHQINSERPGAAVTAREITLEGVHASSALEMWVIFQEHGWNKILEYMALLGGLPSRTGLCTIPHDFGLPNAGIERNQSLFLAGKMTAANFWPEKMRAGDVDERSFDLQAELALEKQVKADAEAKQEALKLARETQLSGGAAAEGEGAEKPTNGGPPPPPRPGSAGEGAAAEE